MEIPSSQATNKPSFKQVLIQDNRDSRPSIQDIFIGGAFDPEVDLSNLDLKPKVSYVFPDNVPNFDTYLLSNVCKQLYLIDKILGESLPLKFIISKCLSEWKLSGENGIIDTGDDFSLVKFSKVMGHNKVLRGQPWFLGGQIHFFKDGRKILILYKKNYTMFFMG